MNTLRTIIGVILLASVSLAQGARIAPPQPNYSQYGSYDRQLTVYENAQRRLDALELERYRKFREEVARHTVQPQVVVVRTTQRSGYDCWQDRRRSAPRSRCSWTR